MSNLCKPYYLHFSVGKADNGHYTMYFWANGSRHNAQHGKTLRTYAVSECSLPEALPFPNAYETMKIMFDKGVFDEAIVMSDMTVKDMKYLGVSWR